MSQELDELAMAAGRGDQQALADLLRALQDALWRFCVSQLGDRHAAEDAVQETAVRIVRGVRRFGGRSTAKTWALGIALNVCREHRRKRARTAAPLSEDPVTEAAPPSLRAMKAEGAEAVHAWVAALPDRQREAIVLRYFEGMSVDEAAAAMGCAPGTVKAAVFAGLRTLRQAAGVASQTEP
ncbi:MAG: RNA polymerase sigma factor [Planctomycetota bacterium]